MKKLIALFLATLVSLSAMSMVACNPDDKDIDKTKTQLYVSNYDSGIGRKWIETIADSFEEDFATYSFEKGKTGVQVVIDHNRTDAGAKLLSDINSSKNNVFFTVEADYAAISKEKTYDVTDIVNQGAITGVDDAGNLLREEKTIESKITPELRDYLNRGTETEENYRGLPYYLGCKGFVFDRDLWNEKYYFCGKGLTPSEKALDALAKGGDDAAVKKAYDEQKGKDKSYWFYVNSDGQDAEGTEIGLAAGPDGKYGTYDDGMPATFDEFYALMDKMVGDNITPFIWTGKFAGYADFITSAVWQAFDGAENLKTYHSLYGTHDKLVVFENGRAKVDEYGVPQTESMTFNGGVEDGFNVQRSLGKYYALQFAERIANESEWTASECYTAAVSHITAQSTYLSSVNAEKGNRIAIIAEGTYWQQESDQTFEIMATKDEKYSKMNRDFALLCAPNPTVERLVEREKNDIRNTWTQASECYCLVNNNMSEDSPQLAAAKVFVSYVNNDEMLNLFTEITQMSRALNYEITEDTYAKLTPYGKNLIDYTNSSDIVYASTSNPLFLNNYQYMANRTENWNWHFKHEGDIGGKEVEHYYPMTQLHDSNNKGMGLNGTSLFEGLYRYYKDIVWPRLIK